MSQFDNILSKPKQKPSRPLTCNTTINSFFVWEEFVERPVIYHLGPKKLPAQ
jgi:hypothetical protein